MNRAPHRRSGPALVLASSSPRRRELLAGLGLSFIVDPAEVDEDGPTSFPDRTAVVVWVASLAAHKADTVAARYGRRTWVLGADTIVVLGTEVLNKPADRDEAVAMLMRLQGRTHTVMTAVALRRGGSTGGAVRVADTQVTFYPATRAEVEAYVDAGESYDKAGGYAAQGRGALIIERIEGCYFNVVGLPLAVTARMLSDVGIDVWAAGRGPASEATA